MNFISQPLITIALPIYNAEKTLACAVASIISQSFQDWELLLLDDGSTDGSLAIANGFLNDQRILVISDKTNLGISARLNQALDMAHGRYFCRMDADDISFPERIEKQFLYLEQHPEIDLCASSVVVFRDDGSLSGVVAVAEQHSQICRRPWNGFHFPHPTWFGKTSWFKLWRYSISANGAEDQLLLYRSFRQSSFAGISDVLLAYREDRRSFKKMLGRRLVFLRAFASAAKEENHFIDCILLLVIQAMKIMADFLNLQLGIYFLRNKLVEVDSVTENTWLKLCKEAVLKKTDNRF